MIPSIVDIPDPDRAPGDGGADDAGGSGAAGGRRPARSLTPDALGREHVRHTVRMLLSYSAGLSGAVDEGRCAIVGLEYALADGRVRVVEASGPLPV